MHYPKAIDMYTQCILQSVSFQPWLLATLLHKILTRTYSLKYSGLCCFFDSLRHLLYSLDSWTDDHCFQAKFVLLLHSTVHFSYHLGDVSKVCPNFWTWEEFLIQKSPTISSKSTIEIDTIIKLKPSWN